MSAINLLPWREARKKKKTTLFLIVLSICCFVILVACYAVKIYVNSMIDTQNSRNEFLQIQTLILDNNIAEIEIIKKERSALFNRINLIKQLEAKRNITTRLFNVLPDITPPGVYLTSLNFKNNRVDVKGVTESNEQISQMVRNIEHSSWLGEASLPSIVAGASKPINLYKFSMSFNALSEEE